MKKEPVGTIIEFPANWEDQARNKEMQRELQKMFGPPGVQEGRLWWRRHMYRKYLDHSMHRSHLEARYVNQWTLRLYFRNASDASYVKLKYQ